MIRGRVIKRLIQHAEVYVTIQEEKFKMSATSVTSPASPATLLRCSPAPKSRPLSGSPSTANRTFLSLSSKSCANHPPMQRRISPSSDGRTQLGVHRPYRPGGARTSLICRSPSPAARSTWTTPWASTARVAAAASHAGLQASPHQRGRARHLLLYTLLPLCRGGNCVTVVNFV